MSTTGTPVAPREWRGRHFEDFDVGDVYRSRLGRTTDIRLPAPVFVGDTLCESEILELRASEPRPKVGIVSLRSRGVNQRAEVVVELLRTFMVPRRGAAPAPSFPQDATPWGVGPQEEGG